MIAANVLCFLGKLLFPSRWYIEEYTKKEKGTGGSSGSIRGNITIIEIAAVLCRKWIAGDIRRLFFLGGTTTRGGIGGGGFFPSSRSCNCTSGGSKASCRSIRYGDDDNDGTDSETETEESDSVSSSTTTGSSSSLLWGEAMDALESAVPFASIDDDDDDEDECRRVHFDSVHVREYALVRVEHPVAEGIAIGLSWHHSDTRIIDVDVYEDIRAVTRKGVVPLTVEDRLHRLSEVGLFSNLKVMTI